MAPKLTKMDLQYQTESDARTLANYQELLGDKVRMNRAMKEAARQAQDLSKRVNVLKAASRNKKK